MKSLVPGGKVLLTAHSNTLRALVSYLDEVPTERVHNLHIPNSVPCVYRFDKSGKVVSPMLDSVSYNLGSFTTKAIALFYIYPMLFLIPLMAPYPPTHTISFI